MDRCPATRRCSIWILESLHLEVEPRRNAGLRRFIASKDASGSPNERWKTLVDTLTDRGHVVRRTTGGLRLTREGRLHLKTELHRRLDGLAQLPFVCGVRPDGLRERGGRHR